MLARVLEVVAEAVKPGVTTKALADLARSELNRLGGKPAFLGYGGEPPFPDVICISLNDEVVHGVPGDRQLANGDLVGLDFGVLYDGLITDGAITVTVGDATADKRRLVEATQQSLVAGIAQVKAGARVGDISHAVEAVLRQAGLGIVEELVGHGVGHELHEEPSIPNFGPSGQGMRLQAGMTIAIEPMATLGGSGVVVKPDQWTVATADGSLAAHFEHTVLVTETGAEILTK